MEEFESICEKAHNKAEKNKEKFERLDKILTEAKAGLKHLVEKLTLKVQDEQLLVITEDTLVEAITLTEEDLK